MATTAGTCAKLCTPSESTASGPRSDLIDPIWEYHHSIGKSITGGGVYRGNLLPELRGAYLYADYVAGTVNALRYDRPRARVVANQPIRTKKMPIVSFGEDQDGEMYFLSITATGEASHASSARNNVGWDQRGFASAAHHNAAAVPVDGQSRNPWHVLLESRLRFVAAFAIQPSPEHQSLQ